jgi:HEAT repeat protein
MTGPVVPKEIVADLLGVEKDKQIQFTGQILEALERISPDLVPKLNDHPYVDAIVEGPTACPTLLSLFKSEESEQARASILDAIAQINQQYYASKEVAEELQEILSVSDSEVITSMAARALAAAKHEGFLQQQSDYLFSDSPSQVRISARLLGYGAYEPATERLLTLLQPDNMAVADAVVWALGEIGSDSALPTLHGMLTASVLTDDVIDAVGKIGNLTSVVRLLALLLEGTQSQREKAARAMSRVARANSGDFEDKDLQHRTVTLLERLVEKDASLVVRFHSIVAHSLLGGHMLPAQITKALGARLAGPRMNSVADFFANRGPKV